MSEILEKIDRAEKKVADFKRLAAKIYAEANADNFIDAEEKKEIAFVANQIKSVQAVIQELKDEFARNKASWESYSGSFDTFKNQLLELVEWAKPDIKPVESSAEQLLNLIEEQRWLDAIALFETLQNNIKPLFDEFEIQAAAKSVFETVKTTVETALAVVTASPFQSETVATGIQKVADRITETAQLVADYNFKLAEEIIQKGETELKETEAEISRLLGLKTEHDDLLKSMAQRLSDAKTSVFQSLEFMMQDMVGMETKISKLVEKIDYDAGLEFLKELGTNLVAFEKDFAKIEADKALYEERLDALRPELLDASLNEFTELDLYQKRMAQIRARMDAAALADKYEQALIELDALANELTDYNAALLIAIAKKAYRAQLAEMEPQIYGAAVSNYGPLETLSADIAAEHDKAVSLAASEDYVGASAVLDALAPKLDRYFTELPRIEQDEALYNGQIPSITERFNALSSCEFPQLNVHNNTIIALYDDMLAAAEAGDYPNAVNMLANLATTMTDAEFLLEELNYNRNFYNGEIDLLLARIVTTLDHKFAALETFFTAITTDQEAMIKAAQAMDYPLAVDLMGELSIKLDAADMMIEEQIQLQLRYETAFSAIADDLKTVATCDYPELLSKQKIIIGLSDEFVEQAKQTYYAEAYENLQKAIEPIEDFIAQEAVCKKYIRKRDLAQERVEKLDEITYKTLEKLKKQIKDNFDKLTEQAMTGEVILALIELEKLEKDLKEIEDTNQQLIGLERAYNTSVSDLESDVESVSENSADDANDAAKAVADAYKKMKGLGEEHKFEEGIKQGKVVGDAIAAYYAVLDDILDEKDKYDALKRRTRGNLDTAKTRSEQYPDKLEGDYDALEEDWDEMEADAEDDYSAAIASLGKLDKKIGDFNTNWLAINNAEAAYKVASGPAIIRFKAFPEKEAKAKADDHYKNAKGYMEDMEEHAEAAEFSDAMDDLANFKTEMDEIDEALKTEAEHNAEYNGRHGPLRAKVDALADSDFADELVDEENAAIKALEKMEEAADRRDYVSAMELAVKVDEALKAHNDAEDRQEQDNVKEKSKYEERMLGLERRYNKAKDAKSDDFDAALTKRIQELPKLHSKVTTLAGKSEYLEAYDMAESLRNEIDEVLDLITAAELAAAVSLAEDSSDNDLWDYIEDKGLDIIKSTGKKIMDKAFDKVGGKVDDIYDFGDSLFSLGGSIKDMDIDGIMTDGLAALKNGAKLHPAVMAYENAIDIADAGYDAYKLGKKAWGILTD